MNRWLRVRRIQCDIQNFCKSVFSALKIRKLMKKRVRNWPNFALTAPTAENSYFWLQNWSSNFSNQSNRLLRIREIQWCPWIFFLMLSSSVVKAEEIAGSPFLAVFYVSSENSNFRTEKSIVDTQKPPKMIVQNKRNPMVYLELFCHNFISPWRWKKLEFFIGMTQRNRF